MVNALKRLDKKFLIFAILIICLPIFIIVFLAIIRGCGNTKISHEKYEKKMIAALESYIKKENKIPNEEGEILTVNLDTLVKEGYIKSTEKLLDDNKCEGNVSVRRNGVSVESNDGGFLNYTVNLDCENYSTVSFVDKLKEDLVSSESGLYVDSEGFIYKGDKVNNYVNFFGHIYRIMSIDKDGILKLVKDDAEAVNRLWDNKYNVEISSSVGKNIYKDSKMLEYLLGDYSNSKKINKKARQHIVAYNTCIGKRSSSNYAIDGSVDCSEVLEKQVISLLNVSDYAKASLDVDCVNTNSRSCVNYNYLRNVASSTWTSNASLDNTYDVLYLANGLMQTRNANDYNSYNIVIYMDGNELYTSGEGSKDNPYVFE